MLPLVPANVRQLQKINASLAIDEERHANTLLVFKNWIHTEKHLPDDIDDTYLANFLRLCKGNLEKAKRKFEDNIISRKELSYLNDECCSSMYEALVYNNLSRQCVIAPKLTEDGYRILYGAFPKNPADYNLKLFLKLCITILDVLLYEDSFAGVTIVCDFSHCTMDIVTKLDLIAMGQFIKLFLNILPTRMKNYHILNAPMGARPIIAVMKAVLSEKLGNRIILHHDVDGLRKYFSEDLLPNDYGGTLPSLDDLADVWKKYYLENGEYKVKLKKLRLVGNVPKGKLYFEPSYGFGANGTFRSLQVD